MAGLADHESLLRFLHILSGIVWIGMLYFFNLVNLPLLKFSLRRPFEVNMADKAGFHILAKTVFWFRWGALFTVLFGVILLEAARQRYNMGYAAYFLERDIQGYAILMGVVLGLIMAFNVWFVIWPRQKVILSNNKLIAASTDDAEKKRLGDANAPLVKMATAASRANTWMSIPMLWGMVFGAHNTGSWTYPTIVLGVVLVLMVLYSTQKPKK